MVSLYKQMAMPGGMIQGCVDQNVHHRVVHLPSPSLPHFTSPRYWLSVKIPHLACEWTARCPFCACALDPEEPTTKLMFC